MPGPGPRTGLRSRPAPNRWPCWRHYGVSETTIRRRRARARHRGSQLRRPPPRLGYDAGGRGADRGAQIRAGLSLDDITEVIRRCVHPGLSPRVGLARAQAGGAEARFRVGGGVGRFEATACGYVHVDLMHLGRLRASPSGPSSPSSRLVASRQPFRSNRFAQCRDPARPKGRGRRATVPRGIPSGERHHQALTDAVALAPCRFGARPFAPGIAVWYAGRRRRGYSAPRRPVSRRAGGCVCGR